MSFSRLKHIKMRGNVNSRMERLRLKSIRKNREAHKILKKIDRELTKRRSDLTKVLLWQKKATKFLNQALNYVKKRDEIKRLGHLETEVTKSINFNIEKVSERFVKKFGATSCVFRAKMQSPENLGTVKVKDITEELNSVFTNAIEQVTCILI